MNVHDSAMNEVNIDYFSAIDEKLYYVISTFQKIKDFGIEFNAIFEKLNGYLKKYGYASYNLTDTEHECVCGMVREIVEKYSNSSYEKIEIIEKTVKGLQEQVMYEKVDGKKGYYKISALGLLSVYSDFNYLVSKKIQSAQ